GPQGSCMPARCGDGFVWNTDGGDEICDDGEETPTCDSDCTEVECGDGQLNVAAGEGCDDGNTIDGDGCSSSCQPDDGCADCDAGVDAGPDGGTKKGSGGDDGGCGCRVPGGNAISNLGGGGERGLLAFGLLALALARARRRRGRR